MFLMIFLCLTVYNDIYGLRSFNEAMAIRLSAPALAGACRLSGRLDSQEPGFDATHAPCSDTPGPYEISFKARETHDFDRY